MNQIQVDPTSFFWWKSSKIFLLHELSNKTVTNLDGLSFSDPIQLQWKIRTDRDKNILPSVENDDYDLHHMQRYHTYRSSH